MKIAVQLGRIIDKIFCAAGVTVLILVPIGCVAMCFATCMEGSRHTLQKIDYWLPEHHEIVRDIPEDMEKMRSSFLPDFETFTNAFADKKMFVKVDEGGTQYFVVIGNVLFFSSRVPFKGEVWWGLGDKRYSFSKPGEVVIRAKRAWPRIISRSCGIGLIAGAAIDVLLVIIFSAIFPVLDDLWTALRGLWRRKVSSH